MNINKLKSFLFLSFLFSVSFSNIFAMQEIFEAINKNDLKSLEQLASDKNSNSFMNINKPNDFGYTPLALACEKNRLDIVKFLILNCGARASINYFNFFAQKPVETPLYIACKKGNLDMIKFLIKEGASLNKFEDVHSPLYFACNNNELAIAMCLMENGAEIYDKLKTTVRLNYPESTTKNYMNKVLDYYRLGEDSEGENKKYNKKYYKDFSFAQKKFIWNNIAFQKNNIKFESFVRIAFYKILKDLSKDSRKSLTDTVLFKFYWCPEIDLEEIFGVSVVGGINKFVERVISKNFCKSNKIVKSFIKKSSENSEKEKFFKNLDNKRFNKHYTDVVIRCED